MTHYDLSPESWLERADGEWYVYTTNAEVAAAWWTVDGVQWSDDFDESDEIVGPSWWGGRVDDAEAYRAPLRALLPVYRYAEGEPWCWYWIEFDSVRVERDSHEQLSYSVDWSLHLRAALLCGGSAESLRVLHEAMKEVEDE